MSKTLHIIRTHNLDYKAALRIVDKWQEAGEEDYNLILTSTEESDQQKSLSFQRKGLTGVLIVTPDQFELTLKLGFLFSAYGEKIEKTIHENMDALL